MMHTIELSRVGRKAWAQRATAMLVQAGVNITRLPGGSYRILSANNMMLVHDIGELSPLDVKGMLDAEARYSALNA